jgi:hypothetical protein
MVHYTELTFSAANAAGEKAASWTTILYYTLGLVISSGIS